MTPKKTTPECDVFVIGNGFAGRTVAGALKRKTIIVERGETISMHELSQRFKVTESPYPRWKTMLGLYKSRHKFNEFESLGEDCFSNYILVDGGCSNHWDGHSFRLEPSVFDDPIEGHEWPFSYSEMVPYYERAEQLLRISADPKDPYNRSATSFIRGGDIWRQSLDKFFPNAYMAAQAHNLSSGKYFDQGQCFGVGDCELCPFDAKTRSTHFIVDHPVIKHTVVRSLVFDGDIAVKAICENERGQYEISFNEVVIAAHGIESLKILWNSALPHLVPASLIGRFYQDHAIAELACEIPGTALPYMQVNTKSALVIPELSGDFEGIRYQTVGLLTVPPSEVLTSALDLDLLNEGKVEKALTQIGSTLEISVLLEVPPQWDISVAYLNGRLHFNSSGYHTGKLLYDGLILEIYSKMKALGVRPLLGAERPHYRHTYGVHHLMGTLNMSKGPKGVVDENFRLKGTQNVYVAGSSLFPRCGANNPTVTIVALGLMLAEKLRDAQG